MPNRIQISQRVMASTDIIAKAREIYVEKEGRPLFAEPYTDFSKLSFDETSNDNISRHFRGYTGDDRFLSEF